MLRKVTPSLLGWREQLDRDEKLLFAVSILAVVGLIGGWEFHKLLGFGWFQAFTASFAVGGVTAWAGLRWGPAVPIAVVVLLRIVTWYGYGK